MLIELATGVVYIKEEDVKMQLLCFFSNLPISSQHMQDWGTGS